VLLLAGILRVAGYTSVSSATNPEKVYNLHRTNRYALILLDLEMPRMTGFEVMERLTEIETDGYLPVIVITAHHDKRMRALKAGARDFLSKPFDVAELQVRVHDMVEARLLHLRSTKLLEATRKLTSARDSKESSKPVVG